MAVTKTRLELSRVCQLITKTKRMKLLKCDLRLNGVKTKTKQKKLQKLTLL